MRVLGDGRHGQWLLGVCQVPYDYLTIVAAFVAYIKVYVSGVMQKLAEQSEVTCTVLVDLKHSRKYQQKLEIHTCRHNGRDNGMIADTHQAGRVIEHKIGIIRHQCGPEHRPTAHSTGEVAPAVHVGLAVGGRQDVAGGVPADAGALQAHLHNN